MKAELQKYIDTIPAVADAAALKETFWLNDRKVPEAQQNIMEVHPDQIKDASDRLLRFAPYLKKVFPELEETVKANDAAEKAVLDLGEFVSEQADRHALSYGEMRYGNYASVRTNTLPVDNGGELEILKGHTYGNGRRYDYGVTATYGSSTYATMKFEGGETYGPRRYRAVL